MRPLGTDDPRRIGAYQLLGLLGSGGMGRVYLGRNAGGRTVAVKVIRPDLINDEFRERFRREVTAARRVGGKFTAPVLDADVDAHPPWLATGYVAGLSLTDAVEQFGTFTENSVLVLAHGLAEALVAVHGAGIVHRDLKPSNVLLAVDGPRVIDFGIARAAEDTALTTTGNVVGSPGFMCPEQVVGPSMGPPGDIFALGGVLVYAATGHGPFGVGETVQMLYRVVYEEPRLDAVPDRLRPLVAACLTKDPDARPTPQQVLDQLAELDVPERGGWLPGSVLEEVSRRAVALLDLESGPLESRFDAPTVTRPMSTPGGQAPGTVSWPGAETPVPQGNSPGRPISNPGNPMVGPGSWPGSNDRTQGWAGNPGSHPGRPTGGPGSHQSAPRMYSQHPPASDRSGPPPDYFAQPPNNQPQRPKPSSRRRIALIAGAVIACVVGAVAVFNPRLEFGSPSTNSQADWTATYESTTEETSTEETPTENPSTTAEAGAALPQAFVGTWTGTASDGLGSYAISLSLNAGSVGEHIGDSVNTGKIVGIKCGRAETLTASSAGQITLTAQLTENGGGCNDDGATTHLELEPNGTLSYRTRGIAGDLTGTLTRH